VRKGHKKTAEAAEKAPSVVKTRSRAEALASLAPWVQLTDEPSRWGALGGGEKLRIGEGLRDLFLAERGLADEPSALGRALAAAVCPEPVAQVDGLDLSFYPGGRFRQVRFIDERCLDASRRALVARSGASPSLLVVFVDPQEFSFRTFENLIPLDHHFDPHPVELTLADPRPLGARCEAWSCALRASEATRDALQRLDTLGLYVPPLDTSARGGQRFIFRSAPLAEALTRAIRERLLDAFGPPGRFVHVNPVFRCNRFEPGDERFHRHLDNPYFDRDRRHISRYTVLLYLTCGEGSPALQLGDDVALTAIDALTCVVFDQRLEHEGAPYTDGRKVFLRSELIFEVDELTEVPAAGESFARACYLTGESLSVPALASHVNAQFHRAAAAHQGAPTPGGDAPGPFIHREFRGLHFVSNGYDFWFPRGGLSLPQCAALALLDFFNARVDGYTFHGLCRSEVVHASDTAWIEPLLSPHAAPPAPSTLSQLDRKSLFPAPPAPDSNICCSFHYSNFYLHPEVIERYSEAQQFSQQRLASAPVVLMGQTILIDPARFIVDENRIHILSDQALDPVHFAACQNSTIPPGILVGVGSTLEALRPLVPPILFAESGGCYHLRFDFFRNSWGVELRSQPVPVPELLTKLDEPHMWGASPWDAVERQLSGGELSGVIAGLRWWEGRRVVVSFEGNEVDASDPSTDPDTLWELLRSGDVRARVAAAANPNLPADELAELLAPRLDRYERSAFDRGEEHVAAWQNPAVPMLMLQQPREEYAEAACLVLMWLEHLHGVRKGSADDSLRSRLGEWQASWAPPRRAQVHDIVRDFAMHLATLFGQPADEPEDDLDELLDPDG
jgi:hypothetical protein